MNRPCPSRAPGPEEDGEKALLLRVGMDRGAGGALGPVFQDGSFEYVPIPETVCTRSSVTYATLPGRRVSPLAAVLPARLASRKPHIDPDFAAGTYGDAAFGKRRQLLRLSRDDLIVFYAGLAPSPPEDRPRLFAIGAFTVARVHDLRGGAPARPDLKARFGQTAHFLREPQDPELALVEAEEGAAAFFQRAIPLGDGQDRMLPDLASLGYRGSLLRSVGHWIRGAERLRSLRTWLAHGPASLADRASRLLRLEEPPKKPGADGTLAFELRDAREGDWFVSPSRPDGLRAFGRINMVQDGDGARQARSSLFWLFLAGDVRTPGPNRYAARAAAIAHTDEIRRLAGWLHAHYRVGVHLSAVSASRPAPS